MLIYSKIDAVIGMNLIRNTTMVLAHSTNTDKHVVPRTTDGCDMYIRVRLMVGTNTSLQVSDWRLVYLLMISFLKNI